MGSGDENAQKRKAGLFSDLTSLKSVFEKRRIRDGLSLVLTCEISTGVSTRQFKDVHISDIRMRSVSHGGNILVYN